MVQDAQNSKAPIARLADTISSYFVPVVMILAVWTSVIWFVVGRKPQLVRALVTKDQPAWFELVTALDIGYLAYI